MIAIGIGCRKGCSADEIVGLVREALARAAGEGAASGLFTIADRAGERGLVEAAAALALKLVAFEAAVLRRYTAAAVTRSPRVAAIHDLPSVAETAALAGAGDDAVLLFARLATLRATCAVARATLSRAAL